MTIRILRIMRIKMKLIRKAKIRIKTWSMFQKIVAFFGPVLGYF
jgi:hypothetical protein